MFHLPLMFTYGAVVSQLPEDGLTLSTAGLIKAPFDLVTDTQMFLGNMLKLQCEMLTKAITITKNIKV